MSSVDGERGLKLSSEERFKFECSPCAYDRVVKEAKYVCSECDDYFCVQCMVSHNRFKGTRNHDVILLKDMQESGNGTQHTRNTICSCIRNLKAQRFCNYHCEVFCLECENMRHRQCKTFSVDELVDGLDDDFDKATYDRISVLKNGIGNLKAERKQDLETVCSATDACKEEIVSLNMQLNEHINKLKRNTLHYLEVKSNLQKENIEQHITACDTALKELSLAEKYYEHAKESGNKKQHFLASVKLKQTLKYLNDVTEGVRNEVYKPFVSLERNQVLIDVLDAQQFGSVYTNLPGQGSSFLADTSVKSWHNANIKAPYDNSLPWISGSAFLPNGDLILCDRTNGCLKYFDQKFTFVNCLKLSDEPRDCCLINHDELIVTLPAKQQIQHFQTVPSMVLKKSISFNKQCEGVDSVDQDVIVTCHCSPDKEVRIIDHEGHVKKIILLNEADKADFKVPYYVKVASTGDIFVSETSENFHSQIRCFTQDGICKYIFSDTDKKGGVGMLDDVCGRLLICFWASNTIGILGKDGNTCKNFFRTDVGIRKPYSLCFRKKDNILVVTLRDNNTVLVCEMEWQIKMAP